MNRRAFIELSALGSGLLAGCGGITDHRTPRTPRDRPDTIFVAPDGSSWNQGSVESPLGSIQAAIKQAEPGQTVHVMDGEYRESVNTVRPGRPDAPITIAGGANAVLRSTSNGQVTLSISHSHIHLRGLTINGLHDPSNPDDPDSYQQRLVHGIPPGTKDYLEDIVCAPAGIGNAARPLMLFNRTKHLEIGPTEIIGMAGAVYVLGDAEDHTGEIIYLGTPPEIALREEPRPMYPWDGLDQTRHVHIHHIDNSAGHPHSELVNTKLGTRDVLVEYCTSLGGSQNAEPYPTAEVRFQGHDATLRWSELRGGDGYGVHVVQHRDLLRRHPQAAVAPEQSGTAHSIYGNVITGFGKRALELTTGRGAQRVLCGNVVPAADHGSVLRACPSDLPAGDGIGHAHTPSSAYPSFRPIELRFNRTLSPSERGAPAGDDAHIAFICHDLALHAADGEVVLYVDVGKESEDGVVFGAGVYPARRPHDRSFRAFGGEDETARLYFTDRALSRSSRLLLRGRGSADDIVADLYLDGQQFDQVSFVDDESRAYALTIEAA